MNRMQLPPTNGNQNQIPNGNQMTPNQAFPPPSIMAPPQPFAMFPPNAMAPSPVPVQTFRQTLLPFPVFQRPLPFAAPVPPILAPPLSQPQATSNFRYNYNPNANQHNAPNQVFNNGQQMSFSNPTQKLRPLAMSKKRKAVDFDDFRNELLQRKKSSNNFSFLFLFHLTVQLKQQRFIV